MPNYILTGLNIRPPEGLTPGGKLHTFQQRTVEKLTAMTTDFMAVVVSDLRARMGAAYRSPDATGRAAKSLRAQVKGDRANGVTANIVIGSFREVNFITNLAGGEFVGSSPYPIEASEATRLVFRWRRVGRVFVGKVVNHPGFPAGDVLMDGVEEAGINFRMAAMLEVSRGLTELTSGSSARASSAPVSRKFHR